MFVITNNNFLLRSGAQFGNIIVQVMKSYFCCHLLFFFFFFLSNVHVYYIIKVYFPLPSGLHFRNNGRLCDHDDLLPVLMCILQVTPV